MQINSSLNAAIGSPDTATAWRTAIAAAMNGQGLCEVLRSSVVYRSYTYDGATVVPGADGSGGIRFGKLSNCTVFANACDFADGALWTIRWTLGSHAITAIIGSEFGVSGNLGANERGLGAFASMRISDPLNLVASSGSSGLTSADLTLIGRFKIPSAIGGQSYTYHSGGFGLQNGRTSGRARFYVTKGNRYRTDTGFTAACALVEEPATLGSPTETNWANIPAASVIQSTNDFLDGSVGRIFITNGEAKIAFNGAQITGIGHDAANNKLVVAVNTNYAENAPAEYNGGFFVRSADLTQTATTAGPGKVGLRHPRYAQGGVYPVPSALQTRFNCGPFFTSGACGVSVNADICLGPGVITFDPAQITSAGATATAVERAAYDWASGGASRTFAEANGVPFAGVANKTHENFSPWFDWTTHYRGGLLLIPGKQVAVAVASVGRSRAFYKSDDQWQTGGANYAWTTPLPLPQNDPTNPTGNAPRQYPYKRVLQVINFSELDAVTAGTKQPHQVAASGEIELQGFPFGLISGGTTHAPGIENSVGTTPLGSAYDELTNRIYIMHGGVTETVGGGGTTFVDVYEVAT